MNKGYKKVADIYVSIKLFRNEIDWIIIMHTKIFHLTQAVSYFIIVVYVFRFLKVN